MTLSVIVPALNEESALPRTLARLRSAAPGAELIVADGGSADRTVETARAKGATVIQSARGRAHQMNSGARAASGGLLLFVHADCLLPEGAAESLAAALSDASVSAAAFRLRIDHAGMGLRLIESMANLRTLVTRIPFGDQGLCVRRADFERIGGFADIPLMEDIEIARRLKRLGRIAILPDAITASARRWLREGVVRTTLRDWRLQFSYLVLGTPPERLAAHYRDAR